MASIFQAFGQYFIVVIVFVISMALLGRFFGFILLSLIALFISPKNGERRKEFIRRFYHGED